MNTTQKQLTYLDMNTETKEALLKSIEHGRAIVKKCEDEDPKIDIGPKHCSLCEKFFPGGDGEMSEKIDCAGCPVKDETGKSRCKGTPYEKFEFLLEDVEDEENTVYQAWTRLTKAAKKELEFLELLLPEEEK